MKENDFKNTIVLKNIPSNFVEEAIIVLKENKEARRLQKIENKKRVEEDIFLKQKDYVIKEAEFVISSYIETQEIKDDKYKQACKNTNYTRLKKYACFSTAVILIQLLLTLL